MIVQVHAAGLHILKAGKEVAHSLSKVGPGAALGKYIKAAAVEPHHVALILADSSLVYLELNAKGELVPVRVPYSCTVDTRACCSFPAAYLRSTRSTLVY